jgi:hypothetical protein
VKLTKTRVGENSGNKWGFAQKSILSIDIILAYSYS